MTTIQTKGVYDSHSGAAGWAAVIGDRIAGGTVHDRIAGVHEAELFAMTGGLIQALKRGEVKRGQAVRFLTTERHVIAILLATAGARARHDGDVRPARRVSGRVAGCPALVDLQHLLRNHDLTIEIAYAATHEAALKVARECMQKRKADLK